MSEELSPRIKTIKKLTTSGLESDQTLHLDPATAAEVFQHPRPKIIEAVENNDFQDFDELFGYVKENIEDSDPRDVKLLFENAVIGHPTSDGGCNKGRITHNELPIEVHPDLILSAPYMRETGYIAEGYKGFIVRSKERILEVLSDLEHEQWRSWINYCINNYNLPSKLVQKWSKNDKPYEELPEEEKEKDRKWARKAINAMRGREP